jgi:hypothetical protein
MWDVTKRCSVFLKTSPSFVAIDEAHCISDGDMILDEYQFKKRCKLGMWCGLTILLLKVQGIILKELGQH